MPYVHCDKKIRLAFLGWTKRSPLLRYALDPEYLPNDRYNAFARDMDKRYGEHPEGFFTYLDNVPHFVSLFAVRAFFEKGDGQNYRETFKSCFPQVLKNQLDNVVLTRLFSNLFFEVRFAEGSNARCRFLRECWVLAAEHAGTTSEVWRTLIPLVDAIPGDHPTFEQAATAASNFLANQSDSPEYFQYLIDEENSAFVRSLIAMRSGRGEGWLAPIAQLWRRNRVRGSVTAGWKLYVNGGLKELHLVVDHGCVPRANHDAITALLSQDKNHVERRLPAHESSTKFRIDELQQRGFDVAHKIDCRIGAYKASVRELQYDGPLVFRYPLTRRMGWMPMISRGQHVCARGIVAVWPDGVKQAQSLTLGKSAVASTILGNVRVPGVGEGELLAQAFEIETPGEPQPLIWNGQELLRIGAKPYLDVAETDLKCPQNPDWRFVLGEEAAITLKNGLSQETAPEWKCMNGTVHGSGCTVVVEPTALGVPVTVACEKARLDLVFIPREVLENRSPEWRWRASENPKDVDTFAREGLECGELAGPNHINLRLTKVRKDMAWWWRDITGTAEGVNTCKEFGDHGTLGPHQLCIWVPEGENAALFWNECEVRSIKGPAFEFPWIRELVPPQLDFSGLGDAVVDHLLLRFGGVHQRCLAHIKRVPNHPALIRSGGLPGVFFPPDADPSEYSVICCYETGLVRDEHQVIPCAEFARGKWSPLDNPHRRQGVEGVWLLLVRSSQAASSLRQFLLQGTPIEEVMTLHEPESTLRDRLGLAKSDGGNARQLLELFAAYRSPLSATPVFRAAISERGTLDLGPASRQAGYWEQYFRKNCGLDPPEEDARTPLEDALGLMFKAGFNWCAEPGWLLRAYKWIVERCNRLRGVKGRRLTNAEKRRLFGACPFIFAAPLLDDGFPRDEDSPIDRRDDGMARYFRFLPSLGDGMRLRIRVPGVPGFPPINGQLRRAEGVPCRGFSHQGVQLYWQGRLRLLGANCSDDGGMQVKVGRESYSAIVTVDNDEAFANYVAVSIFGDTGRIPAGSLEEAFASGLELATPLIGRREEKRLAHMFSLANEKLGEWSRSDPEQCNRQIVYQAAVLSRLHAWLGDTRGYPAQWPLCDASCYQSLCYALSQIWEMPARRDMLMKDLLRIEWFITWFRC